MLSYSLLPLVSITEVSVTFRPGESRKWEGRWERHLKTVRTWRWFIHTFTAQTFTGSHHKAEVLQVWETADSE